MTLAWFAGSMSASALLLLLARHRIRRVVNERVIRNYHAQWIGRSFHRVAVDEKVVALTFDDGPLPPYTGQLLSVLARHRVAATFFFVGRQIERFPDAARQVHQEGHQIGNHSYSHSRLWGVWPSTITREIERTDTLIRRLGVDYDIVFRAPYGQRLLALPWVLWRMGKRHISFDFFPMPRDWKGSPPDQVVGSVLEQTRPGSIIVLHDGNPEGAPLVAEYADRLITELKARGYRFETADGLLALERGA